MSEPEKENADSSYPPEYYMDDDRESETCSHCGKPYEDFSDLGCEYCDRRHPEFFGN